MFGGKKGTVRGETMGDEDEGGNEQMSVHRASKFIKASSFATEKSFHKTSTAGVLFYISISSSSERRK